jgi:hypothetical protein
VCVTNSDFYANGHCNFDADRDCTCIAHAYCYSYGATESYTNSDSYGYIHNHAECYGNGHSYSYCEADAHCPAQRNTTIASHSAAATDVRGDRKSEVVG